MAQSIVEQGQPMDWREEYRDQGFVIVDRVLPYRAIDAHVAEVEALLRRFGVTDAPSHASLTVTQEDDLLSAMLQLHRGRRATRQLIFDRILGSLLRQLFGAKPVLSMARSSFWERGNMRAHVDTAFRSPDPPYSICRCWCALEDIHPNTGRFYLVPKSHRTLTPHLCRAVLDERPELQALFERLAYDPQAWIRLHNRGWSYVSAKVADYVEPNARVSPALNKGDIVIFDPAVAHGTIPCADASLTRKMMVSEWTIGEEATFPARRPARIESTFRKVEQDNLIDITPILAARATSR
jgi:phytanoyl-CoA hydroxylase